MQFRDLELDELLSRVLRLGSMIGLFFAFVGVVLLVWQAGRVSNPEMAMAYPLNKLPGALLRCDPRAIVELGLLLLLATPAVAVLVASCAYAQRKNWRPSFMAAVLLLILLLGAFGRGL